LQSIAVQLRLLSEQRARPRRPGPARPAEDPDVLLASLVSLGEPVPELRPRDLALVSFEDDVLARDDRWQECLRPLAAEPDVDPEILDALLGLAARLRQDVEAMDQTVLDLSARYGATAARAPEFFGLARRFCDLFAASVCLAVWFFNRRALGGFFSRGEWLVVALTRLLEGAEHRAAPTSGPWLDSIGQALLERYDQHRLFSAVPVRLAHADAAPDALDRDNRSAHVAPILGDEGK
jgi:hypothetical protein